MMPFSFVIKFAQLTDRTWVRVISEMVKNVIAVISPWNEEGSA